MAALAGKNMLLKIGTGTGATTVAGLRPTSFTVNGNTVDVTTKDSSGFRELLGTASLVNMSITGGGVLQGGTFDNYFINACIARSLGTYTTNYGTNSIVGAFQVTSYEATGDYDGAQTFNVSLESSGSLTVA